MEIYYENQSEIRETLSNISSGSVFSFMPISGDDISIYIKSNSHGKEFLIVNLHNGISGYYSSETLVYPVNARVLITIER